MYCGHDMLHVIALLLWRRGYMALPYDALVYIAEKKTDL